MPMPNWIPIFMQLKYNSTFNFCFIQVGTDFMITLALAQRHIYVSQLRAGGPVIPDLTSSGRSRIRWSMHRVVTATQFTTVMNTISILWAGMHKPHRKVAGLVLSALVITSSRAIWLSG